VLVPIGSFGTYITLFQDSAYIRDTRSRWSPRWWYYIGGAVAAPVAVYFVSNQVLDSLVAVGTLVMLVHVLSASLMSAVYLYQRHQHIGVP